jgi:predicted nucleotidyltransferase component of viral defense system
VKSKGTRDRAASVRARLLNLARQRGEDFQITLRNYFFERFLYRLGRSPVRERFVLKGAMLLRLWADQPYRSTLDLDLLAYGSSDTESVRRDIASICNTDVDDDGIKFDSSSIAIEPIRAQDEYSGVRVVFGARLGTIQEQLQVDIGFGDAVWPQAEEMEYPAVLGDPAALIRAYRPETVIAEKLEAIVSLGIRNSRIKDFFDIDYLARTEHFDRPALIEAVRRTFQRRATPIPAEPPIGLTPEFWTQPGRDAQVRAFARRARLATTPDSAGELGKRVAEFAVPILQAASDRSRKS